MNNTTTTSKPVLQDRPQTGFIQPSYGRYGGYYTIIKGVNNQFFPDRRRAKEFCQKVGVTPIYC